MDFGKIGLPLKNWVDWFAFYVLCVSNIKFLYFKYQFQRINQESSGYFLMMSDLPQKIFFAL